MEKNCPACGHHYVDKKPDWFGLPAGVKFDPTDPELIEHLEAKMEGEEDVKLKSHPLINEFIPTIEGDDGICYTHPERLPGVTRDGLSRHFFHRPSKAYTTGTRKRRKIQTERCDLGETRWHKTGKTRAVMVNGMQRGCKKILVLYTNFGKNRKPEKTNWVMHQYHVGTHEEEREGELVVSKIFYQTQPRQCTVSDRNIAAAAISGVEMMKSEHLGYVQDSFDEHSGIGEASSTAMGDGVSLSQRVGEDRGIATIICTTPLHHQHTSMVLDNHHHQDTYHLPTMMVSDHNFQEHHHHKVGEMSGAGLEELVMSCTTNIKEEECMANQEDAEWLKYSFWPDPHSSDHHHHQR